MVKRHLSLHFYLRLIVDSAGFNFFLIDDIF